MNSSDLPQITTLSFDGDATLWDFEKVMRHSLGIVLKEIRKAIPGELLHVGDSLPSDVEGAQNAGISAVWLNREGIPNETDIIPDFEIASIAELPALLAVK